RIAGTTDIGLRRDHNEDACYPMLDQPQVEGLRNRVLIICDGLGGHEGGEIASGTAIKTITRMLNTLLHQVEQDTEPFSAQAFIAQLDKIVKVANDQIVALNDQQQRQGQQRMGTTLVMAVVPSPQGRAPHEVYIVHVGDSRAYWIGKNKHYQITADDDVATRETVLGYSFYPYSAQRLDAGALIQALGTRPSGVLLPRIQRFIIDEDCLFLLCSDGLSDYDRVDYLADSHLRPILQKNIPLEDACKVLIAQANALNGHDNISVGLLRCAFGPIIESPDTEPDHEDLTILQEKTDEDEVAEIAQAIQAEAIAAGMPVDPIAPYTPPVVPRQEKKSQGNNWLFMVLTIVGVVLAIGLVAALFRQQGKNNSSPRNHVPSVQELT
ncbi:MAG: PP2C family protein-serine/threonine phosphatase, partial [Pseudanabaenaceae cyanobacterium]